MPRVTVEDAASKHVPCLHPMSDIKKVSPELRDALLIAHDHTCAYTGRPLNRELLEVDHVIPERLAERKHADELRQVLAHYNLPSSFGIRSLANLVPALRRVNQEKKGRTGLGDLTGEWEPEIKRALDRARERLDRVRCEWENQKARARLERSISGIVKRHPDADPARVHDQIAGVASQFPDRDPDPASNEFVMSRSGVRVSCFLPTYPHVQGTALVALRTLTMRGNGITLGHNQILDFLAAGRGGEISPEERPFVVGFGQAAQGGDDPEQVLVQLPHNRFWLSRTHAAQLAHIADRLTAAFLASAAAAERDVLRSAEFARARDSGYRLLRLPVADWALVLAYARAHAYRAGPLPAHAFDVRGGTVVAYAHEANDDTVAPRAVLGSEVDDPFDAQALAAGQHDVWLCWRPTLTKFSDDGAARLATGRTWSVERTHRWLMEHVLPAAAAWAVADARPGRAGHGDLGGKLVQSARHVLSVLSRVPARADTPPAGRRGPLTPAESAEAEALLRSLRRRDGRAAVATSSGPVRWTDLDALKVDVNAMHLWYSVLGGHVAYSALRGAMLGTYALLLECLRCYEVGPGIHPYLDGKIGLRKHPDLADAVRVQAAEVHAGGPVSGPSIDYGLRGVLAILKDGQLRDTPHRVLVAASTHLAPTYELYREAEQLHRLRIPR